MTGPDDTAPNAPGASGTASPSSAVPRRRMRVGRVALAVLLPLAALGSVLGWVAASESGLRALFSLAQRASGGQFVVTGPSGRLIGPFRADAIRFRSADLDMTIDAPAFDWSPTALLSGRVDIDHLTARRLLLARRPTAGSDPAVAPQDLSLPFALAVRRIELGAFELRDFAAPDASAAASEPTDSEPNAERAKPEPGKPEPGKPDSVAPDAVQSGPFEAATGTRAPLFSFTDLSAALASDGRHHRVPRLALTLPQGRAELAAELDGVSPFALSAQGQFSGTQGGRAYTAKIAADHTLLEPRIEADAEGEGLRGHAELRAAPFAPLPLRALKLLAGEIDPSVFVAGAPKAALHIEADLAAPASGDALLSGPVRITNRSPAAIDRGGVPIASLAGQLAWRADVVGVEALDIRLPAEGAEGRVAGRVVWTLPIAAAARAGANSSAAAQMPNGIAVAGFGQIAAALQLTGIDTRALDTRLPRQLVAGSVDVGADAWRQHVALALGAGRARIDAAAELLAGTDEAPSSFTLGSKLRSVDPRALLPTAPSALINLDVDASGTLADETTLQVKFSLPDSRFEGRPLGGAGEFRYAGHAEAFRLSDVALALRLAGNRLQAKGNWGRPGDRLAFKLDAPSLAAIGHGLGGRAGAQGTLGGSLAEPSGEFSFFGEGLRLPGELRIATVNGEARLDAGVDSPFRLSAGLSGLASGANRAGTRAADLITTAYLTADGTRGTHAVRVSATGLENDTIALRLQGGLVAGKAAGAAAGAAPRGMNWAGQLVALETTGRFDSRLTAPAALELAADRVSLAAAELAAGEQGRIRLQETRWTPTASVARGSLTGLVVDLQARDARRPSAPRADRPRRGPGPLVLGAEWDLRMGDTLEGDARLFRESGDVIVEGEIRTRLGLESLEAKLAARGDRLALSWEVRGSELGRFDGSASVRAERVGKGGWRIAQQAPLLGSARLDMRSITWLGRLLRENVETAGSLTGEFTLGGTVADPLASGRINGRELQLALVDQGMMLSGGELDMSFDRDRLRLDRLAFVSPNRVRPRDNRVPIDKLTATPGTLTGRGEIALATGMGDFRFEAERLPLLQRPDRWLIVSGKGTGRSTWTSLDLEADFRADAGYLEFADSPAPSLSDDVVVLGRDDGKASAFGVRADLRVALGDALYMSAMGLNTRLAGELRLRQQPGLPLSAVGTVSTVGGSYRGYGQRLSVERGLVNFQGPLDNPGLNVVALRKGLAVEAGVEILGSARRPLVRLVSEPSVPDPEKLSWIVLGRAPDAASGADLGLLLPAAQALLGGPGGGISDELSRSLGLDSLSIGQGELNSSSRAATSRVVGGGSRIATGPTVSGQVLSVGKRLGSDLFLSFEQSLGGAETLVKLTYQLSRRLSLIARGGTDNSLDLHYSFSFR